MCLGLGVTEMNKISQVLSFVEFAVVIFEWQTLG